MHELFYEIFKSTEQIQIYLKKKGFYDCYVVDTLIYNEKKQKAQARYVVFTGDPYRIGEIKFDSLPSHASFLKQYKRMNKKIGQNIHEHDLFDSENLDAERDRFSKFCRDNAYYGFNKNYISFVVDTTKKDHVANIYIKVKSKVIDDPDNVGETMLGNHSTYQINAVTYYIHNKDSLSFENFSAYKERLVLIGGTYSFNNFD